MALTPTAAWLAAFGRADVEVRFLVTLTAGGTDWKASTGTNTDAYAEGVVDVSAFGSTMDVVTRRQEVGQIAVTFSDAWLRPVWVANRLKGAAIDVQIGAADIAEADYLPYFAGIVDEILPGEDQTIEAQCVDIIARAFDTDVYFPVLNDHPLTALKDLLLLIGFVSGDLNLPSFDPTVDTDRSHWVVSHGSVDPDISSSQLVTQPQKAAEVVSELLVILNGHLIADEDGLVKFSRFDNTAAVAATWTADDFSEDSPKQTGIAAETINRVQVTTGSNAEGEATLFEQDHDDSQTDLGETYLHQYSSPWIAHNVAIMNGPNQWLDDKSPGDSDVAEFFGRGVAMISGSQVPDDFPDTAQAATSKLTASRTAWYRVRDEIVEATDLDIDYWSQYSLVRGPGALFYTGRAPANATCTAKRGALGTTVGDYPFNRNAPVRVIDITIAKAIAEATLDRYAYGLHTIEVETDLSKLIYQIGDLIAVIDDRFLAYGMDGLDASTKWEIVAKEIQTGDSWSIRWTLASATTATGYTTTRRFRADAPKELPQGMTASIDARDLGQYHIRDGCVLSAGTGLHVDVSEGIASAGYARARIRAVSDVPVAATKDNWCYIDTLTGNVTVINQTTATAQPETPPGHALLGVATTDATTVTSVTDSRERKAVHGQRAVAASFGADLPYATRTPSMVLNADFGDFSREPLT